MTDHEAGYVQALMDVQVTIRQMVKELSPSPEGKIELLGVVSFLDIMIKTKMKPSGLHDASDPTAAAFNGLRQTPT